MARKPTRANLSVLAQLCNLIPPLLVAKVARQFGVDKKARTFCPWSHLVASGRAAFRAVHPRAEFERCVRRLEKS